MLGGKFGSLAWMLGNGFRSRASLDRLRDRLLQKVVHRAYENVNFYRRWLDDAGVRPEDIRTVADLCRIPVTDKALLREAGFPEIVHRHRSDRSRLLKMKTSGSSGSPYVFYIDTEYDRFRKAQYLRAYLMGGQKLTDTVFRISDVAEVASRGGATAAGQWFRRLGFLREYRMVVDTDPAKELQEIDRIQPDVIQGYGSSLAVLASHIVEDKRPTHRPRLVFTDSELLTEATRRRIERGFQAPVLDVYGTFETDNIAFQCPRREGYHVAWDSVVLEIVKDGCPVEPGQPGEVVCTVLHNHTMPFIRYNLGDIASYSPRFCSCGHPFPLLRVLEGRSDDVAVGPAGRRRSALAFLQDFDEDWPIREFQMVQVSVESYELLVIPAPGYDDATAQQLEDYLRRHFPGTGAAIRIVDRIERGTSGKHKAFRTLVAQAREEAKP